MLILLIICSVISIVLGSITEGAEGSIEGIAILVAVVIVVSVASGNDYQKQLQFKKISGEVEDREILVFRNGQISNISVFDLAVGDIMVIREGMKLAGDGVYISGDNIKVDESSTTGESDQIRKGNPETEEDVDPFFLSGTEVVDGDGLALCIGVGVKSFNGRIMLALQGKKANKKDEEEESSSGSANEDSSAVDNAPLKKKKKKEEEEVDTSVTPLEAKLEILADQIGQAGMIAAASLVIVLVIIYFVTRPQLNPAPEVVADILNYIITAITIIVVAVPEGLPLAVTIALAYSMKRMMDDHNFVRHLKACEIMGGATAVCTDKTGTLTTNVMTLVAGNVFGRHFDESEAPSQTLAGIDALDTLWESLAVNSSVYYERYDPEEDKKNKKNAGKVDAKTRAIESAKRKLKKKGADGEWKGNKSEISLVQFAESEFNINVNELRESHPRHKGIPFSSERKRMSTVIARPEGGFRLHTKGAAETIVALCTNAMQEDGSVREFSNKQKKKILDEITEFGKDALRVLAVAYRDFDEELEEWSEGESELTFLGIVGIRDPLRPEVPQAVKDCQRSGITVRMVTGDNPVTAENIAIKANIKTKKGVVMEGPVFRKLKKKAMLKIIPRLQVLARSSPLDKEILVANLQQLGNVVAATGDGTNDAPALKQADVGFAMGINGTNVAQEASDIILLDDNFASIVKAVLWGRNVFDSIRKFIQFQLTVNVVAVLTAYVGAVTDAIEGGTGESPLTPVQLLWVNLIMDTFAALALATDPPRIELLDRKPYGRTEHLISPVMAKNVLGMSVLQLCIAFLILYDPHLFHIYPFHGDVKQIESNTSPLCYDYNYSASDSDRAEYSCVEWLEFQSKVQRAFIFNSFVWLQIFAEFNARRISNHEKNVFSGVHKNGIFIAVVVGTALFQALFVYAFGNVGGVTPVGTFPGYLFGISILFGAVGLFWGFLLRFIPVKDKQGDVASHDEVFGKGGDVEFEDQDGEEEPELDAPEESSSNEDGLTWGTLRDAMTTAKVFARAMDERHKSSLVDKVRRPRHYETGFE